MKKYSFLLFAATVILMNCSIFKKSSSSSSGSSNAGTTSSSTSSASAKSDNSYHNLNQEQQLEAVSHLTDQQYSNGMTIYEAKCGKCHDLPYPDSQDVGGWLRIMRSMSEKAKLSNDEEKQVMGYLYTNCRK